MIKCQCYGAGGVSNKVDIIVMCTLDWWSYLRKHKYDTDDIHVCVMP